MNTALHTWIQLSIICIITEKVVKFLMPKPETADNVEVQWMSVAGYLSFVFRVKACENVRIVLGSFAGNLEVSATEIVLGESNQRLAVETIHFIIDL